VVNRLRIYMRSEKACGIREVRLVGYRGEACEGAVLTDKTLVPLTSGESVTLAPQLTLPEGVSEEAIWNWTLADGSTATTPSVTVSETGSYTVTYQRECGNITSLTYTVYDPSESYRWPDYSPTLFL